MRACRRNPPLGGPGAEWGAGMAPLNLCQALSKLFRRLNVAAACESPSQRPKTCTVLDVALIDFNDEMACTTAVAVARQAQDSAISAIDRSRALWLSCPVGPLRLQTSFQQPTRHPQLLNGEFTILLTPLHSQWIHSACHPWGTHFRPHNAHKTHLRST